MTSFWLGNEPSEHAPKTSRRPGTPQKPPGRPGQPTTKERGRSNREKNPSHEYFPRLASAHRDRGRDHQRQHRSYRLRGSPGNQRRGHSRRRMDTRWVLQYPPDPGLGAVSEKGRRVVNRRPFRLYEINGKKDVGMASEKFYVKTTHPVNGSPGWIGPIIGHQQAQNKRNAWVGCGWGAVVHEATPEVRAEVRAWQLTRRKG